MESLAVLFDALKGEDFSSPTRTLEKQFIMLNALAYPARFERKPGGILVTFPDFEDARTFGLDEPSAFTAATDCLRQALANRIKNNEENPSPSECGEGMHLVHIPAEMTAKIAVYQAFRKANISRVQLAKQMSLDESEIRRILDPGHRTKLDRLERIAQALGMRLQVVATTI